MIVDFHTHVFPPECIARRNELADRDRAFGMIYGDPKSRMVSAEELVEALDRQGVGRAVACGFPWQDPGLADEGNACLLEAQERLPGRIYAFYTPALSDKKGPRVRRAQDALARGMAGIGEVALYSSGMGKQAWRFLDSLADVAADRRVPFLLHVNESVGHSYPGKMDIRLRDVWTFVRDHQDLCLVLAHWGGGFFFYELMKSVARAIGTLYYDTAASPFLYKPHIYRIALEIVGPERVLFGSDYPLIPPSRYFKEMDDAEIPREAQKKILGQNALRLLERT